VAELSDGASKEPIWPSSLNRPDRDVHMTQFSRTERLRTS
jgi:hypothetical protein